jgi:replicative DNA helicase
MDDAGRDGTARAADLLSRSRCRPYVISLPVGFKDPDELVRAQGREAFETALQNAERWVSQRARDTLQITLAKSQRVVRDGDPATAECELEHGLRALRASRADMPEPYLLEDFERDLLKTPDGLRTGYPQLDAFLRIPQGALSILGGRPGHGKTTLQLNLLLNFLRQYPDQRFYLFSYEEARFWLALKLIMILAGEILDADHNQAEYIKYLHKERGRLRSFPAIDEAMSTYSSLTSSGRLNIVDRRPCAEDLASTLSRVTRQGNVGAIIIDYIQKIPLRQPLAGQRYQEIKRVSELMLGQAVTQGVPILLGAQLGRSPGTTNGKARVRLDNLRECGDIEQDAALVLGIYNPSADKAEDDGHDEKRAEVDFNISVLKNRAGVQAKQASLMFHRSTLRILDQPQLTGAAVVNTGW